MRTVILLLASTLLWTSCGGGSSDPSALTNGGYEKLGGGDFAAAAKDFEQALASLDTNHQDYLRAKMGHIEANTQINAAQAKDDFLALAEAMPSKITDRHYNQIGGRLGEAEAFTEAIDLVTAGMEAHPESPHLKKLVDTLGDRASQGNDPAALEALKSLGYVGD